MRIIFFVLSGCLLLFILKPSSAIAQNLAGNGEPLKYISSCEIDLNNDGQPDIALLVETLLGQELIVLLRTNSGYNAFLVSKARPGMYLSCHFGRTVQESKALDGEKTYKTPGAYLELHQPEGASVAYFWDGYRFKEVWTAD